MKNSGTKLVLGLACLALVAGLASWSYRYRTTHQSTRFWGPKAAMLIARPSEAEFFQLGLADSAEIPDDQASWSLDLGRKYLGFGTRELTHMRGMVHFRHALMTDANYDWTSKPNPQDIDWRWGMKFYDDQTQAIVVLAEDLATIALVDEAGNSPTKALSCQPMAETLRAYFGTVDIAEDNQKAASTEQ